MNSSETTPKSAISIDWQKFWSFVFRMATGVGLVVFWLTLLAITVGILAWIGISIVKLSFAWLLGFSIAGAVILVCWWICYHVAIDSLFNIGIELTGRWRWIIIPVALPLAPLLFLIGTFSGFGELIRGRIVTIFAFTLGFISLLWLVIAIARSM